MNESTIPGTANGPLTTEPTVVWRKALSSNTNGACVEVAAITTERNAA